MLISKSYETYTEVEYTPEGCKYPKFVVYIRYPNSKNDGTWNTCAVIEQHEMMWFFPSLPGCVSAMVYKSILNTEVYK